MSGLKLRLQATTTFSVRLSPLSCLIEKNCDYATLRHGQLQIFRGRTSPQPEICPYLSTNGGGGPGEQYVYPARYHIFSVELRVEGIMKPSAVVVHNCYLLSASSLWEEDKHPITLYISIVYSSLLHCYLAGKKSCTDMGRILRRYAAVS